MAMAMVWICLSLAMRKVLIGVPGDFTSPSTMGQMVDALEQAILKTSPEVDVAICQIPESGNPTDSPILLSSAHPQMVSRASGDWNWEDVLLCPLTLEVPVSWSFPGQHLYQLCHNVSRLRQHVQEELNCPGGRGNFWLPIVLTTKGPLYGEVIGQRYAEYCQPLHITDTWRQPLYEFGYRLLQSIEAVPATYLIQFGFHEQTLYFDRLWPFPAPPALASLKNQHPDLFTCHWYCLTGRPVYDLKIPASTPYQVYS